MEDDKISYQTARGLAKLYVQMQSFFISSNFRFFYPDLLLGFSLALIFSAGAFSMRKIGLLDVPNTKASDDLQWKSESKI